MKDDRELTLIHGRSLSKQRKYAESEELLLRLMDEAPETTPKILDILIETLRSEPDEFHTNRMSARIYSSAGDTEKVLAHILRILSNNDIGFREIDKAVKEFLPLLKEDIRFTIPYSGLLIRQNKHKKALSGLRRALDAHRPAWSDILSAIEDLEWPEEIEAQASLLRADCLLEGNRPGEAFEAIENISDQSGKLIPKMKKCIRKIIELDQRPEYFIFGSRLLAESGDVAGAEEFTRQGCSSFDEQAAIDLKLQLADALECSDMHGEAARIYVEVLEENHS